MFDFSSNSELGLGAHDLARRLWPINRSLTGSGVVETLEILQGIHDGLTLRSVPTGYQAFDWIVPNEWKVNEAHIIAPDGSKICNFFDNNLHLIGYSQPMRATMSRAELEPYLHSLADQPTAIPYVTSYYGENWGFCLSQAQRDALPEGMYQVCIDTEHFAGKLTYADLVLPGRSDEEILLSTYVCHPSMANNELSGPVVASALAQIIAAEKDRHFTYRFVFVPETIGALIYLSQNLDHMKAKTRAGFVLTCVGDTRGRSFMPSRAGNTLADRAARLSLKSEGSDYTAYSFLQRGSDERQYCAPGIDLPVCSVMNSKYGTFPEYHTSHDNLDFVTPKGLADSIATHRNILRILEQNYRVRTRILGEPQLGRRGLYANLSKVGSAANSMNMRNLVAYADGGTDLIEMSEEIGVDFFELAALAQMLAKHDIVELLR